MEIHRRVKEVLLIRDPEKEDIYTIAGKLEMLVEHFKKHGEKSLLPFLETYLMVTKAVADKKINRRKYFNNDRSMDKIDIIFASLYFEALNNFLSGKKAARPWDNCFKYYEKKNGIAFLQLLLGINAHINGDLALSLYKAKYKEKKDFLKVNKILKEVLPDVFNLLIFEDEDLLGFGGAIGHLAFPEFIEKELKKTILRWRSDAWKNYEKLNGNNLKKQRKLIHKKTEQVSKDLIKIFEGFYKLKDPVKIKEDFERLEVRI